MKKADEDLVRKLRTREKNGILPPVIIEYSEGKGFDVIAAIDLPSYSLICEYLGEVRI